MPVFNTMAAMDEAIAAIRETIPALRDECVRMASDRACAMEDVRKAKAAYLDASERLKTLEEEKARMTDEVAFRLKKDGGAQMSRNEAAGLFYRAALTGGDTRRLPRMLYEQLGMIPAGNADQGNGSVLIP